MTRSSGTRGSRRRGRSSSRCRWCSRSSGAVGWWDAMTEDAATPKDERTERAHYHVAAQQRRDERESAKAQVLIDRFVARAVQTGLPTEELTAAPWSGRGRYRTGVVGWYLRENRSIGVSVDGDYYVLVVPP